jgi:hypothetical protein
VCHDVHKLLPGDVLGAKARATSPKSDMTAAWGDPAVILRCGVPTPVSLRQENPAYDPTQDAFGVNGVHWIVERLGAGKGVRFTTIHREVYVEVIVPASYGQPPGVLTAFSDAVQKADRLTMPDGDEDL